MQGSLEVLQGDITTINVGAIHRAAGFRLLAECFTLGGCKTGDAKITKGYGLLALHVIHTPGPVWKGGHKGEAELLESCYFRCLEIAQENNIKTIAFPCISAGIYRFPKEQAAVIAVNTVRKYLGKSPWFEGIVFVCFSADNYLIYKKLLS